MTAMMSEQNTARMDVTGVDDTLTRIALGGRLDTPGVDNIETRFMATLVPSGRNAIVDLSGVDFISSMGIRMFFSVARSMRQRQAKLALYGARPMVKDIFAVVALADTIPVVEDQAKAIAVVSS
jgi:anti-sigma B factor antagonist